jgi:hypothetical protein
LTVTQTFRWDGGPTWLATDRDPQLADRLASYLIGGAAIGERVPIDAADSERLRSLGYGAP